MEDTKYKNDIGKIDNMEYDENGDFYNYKNNQKLIMANIKYSKSKTSYVIEKTIYRCENCKFKGNML